MAWIGDQATPEHGLDRNIRRVNPQSAVNACPLPKHSTREKKIAKLLKE